MRHSDYETYANECVQLAETAQVPEHRVMLLHIAETWRRLADDVVVKSAAANPGPGKRH